MNVILAESTEYELSYAVKDNNTQHCKSFLQQTQMTGFFPVWFHISVSWDLRTVHELWASRTSDWSWNGTLYTNETQGHIV